MKDDPSLIKQVQPGDIMQITPDADAEIRHRLLVVSKVESWGVVGYCPGATGIIRRTWQFVEPTGGKAVFAPDGRRMIAAPVSKHHA